MYLRSDARRNALWARVIGIRMRVPSYPSNREADEHAGRKAKEATAEGNANCMRRHDAISAAGSAGVSGSGKVRQ